jgi:hypothetical protein
MMQAGVDLWEAAGWLGMTVEQLEANYGHQRSGAEDEPAETHFVAHFIARRRRQKPKLLKLLVGVAGFEPATPASRTQCSTGLSHTPTRGRLIASTFALRKPPNCGM